jgi:hypothetical protein
MENFAHIYLCLAAAYFIMLSIFYKQDGISDVVQDLIGSILWPICAVMDLFYELKPKDNLR